jgi:hypothetical protein
MTIALAESFLARTWQGVIGSSLNSYDLFCASRIQCEELIAAPGIAAAAM